MGGLSNGVVGVNVLVCGYDHFGFVDAVAHGFANVAGWQSETFTHSYEPVRKMVTGPWLKRAMHGRRTRRLNRELLARVSAGRYDMVLCIEGGCLLPETVSALARNARVCLWCLDSARRVQLASGVFEQFERVFFFEPTDVELYAEGRYLPVGFDDRIYHKRNDCELRHDLVWVGSAHEDRLSRLEAMAQFAETAGFDMGVYGQFYRHERQRRDLAERFPALLRALQRNDRIAPVEANEIYNSARISVNLHYHDPLSQGLNPRTFEVPAAGSLLLTDEMGELAKAFVPDQEVVVFANEAEFASKASEYLTDDAARRRIAEAGHTRARMEHSFAARCRTLVKEAGL